MSKNTNDSIKPPQWKMFSEQRPEDGRWVLIYHMVTEKSCITNKPSIFQPQDSCWLPIPPPPEPVIQIKY